MSEREDWLVMDSRAQYDTDVAAILEACGQKRPSWKELRREWGGQEAVLVRCYGWTDAGYTKTQVIGVIK